MSDDIVISKKLMERVVDNLEYLPLDQTSELIKQLRSLPETVSLEGVENHVKNVINSWKKSWTVRLSSRAEGALRDRFFKFAQNLVTPVQPSAVVSREDIDLGDWSEIIETDGTDDNGRNIRESWVRKVEAEEAIYQLSLQLPQTLAPVQSGGVEHPECHLANILSLTEMNTEYRQGGMPQLRDWIVWRFKDRLAHLTTTQSAPAAEVPSVEPSMEALIEWACNVETTELDEEAEAFANRGDKPILVPDSAARGFYVGWKLALLTSLTEGK